MSLTMFVLGALLMAASLVGAGILIGRRWPASKSTAPKYWVGISVYEGEDPAAAADAYREMQSQYHTLPGQREWMLGEKYVRIPFKVV